MSATFPGAKPATPPSVQVKVLRFGVHAYRYGLRPIIGSHCRFHPHCSDYALDALATHGAARGSLLTIRRILCCHPWHPGGWDPVPPASADRKND